MSQNARCSAVHVRASYIIVTNSNVGLSAVRNTVGQAPLVQTVCSAMSHDCTVVSTQVFRFPKLLIKELKL